MNSENGKDSDYHDQLVINVRPKPFLFQYRLSKEKASSLIYWLERVMVKRLCKELINKNAQLNNKLKKAKQIGIGFFAGVSHVGEPVIGVGLVWRLW